MTAAEIIGQVLAAGGQIAADGADLVLTAPRPLPDDLLNRLKSHKPAILAALAHPDLPGVSPQFAACLSAKDLEDIAVGDTALGTVQAFEQAAIAREAEDRREAFEERAAILEFDAGLPRDEAELEAARSMATLARNRTYPWASLRASLADYPVLAAQMPFTDGPVNALPWGLSTVVVRKDKRVGGRERSAGRRR